jgi:hypothetical protein
MNRIYWVNTQKYCGAISVDQNGRVYGPNTAPCYKWMSGKRFSDMISYLKRKNFLLSYRKIRGNDNEK